MLLFFWGGCLLSDRVKQSAIPDKMQFESYFCGLLSQEREQVMPLMMKGFRDAAEEGGTSVTGGQTVVNPWIIIGGVATVVCQPTDFIMWVFWLEYFLYIFVCACIY